MHPSLQKGAILPGIFEAIDIPEKLAKLEQRCAGGQYVALLLWLGGAALVHFEFEKVIKLSFIVSALTYLLYRLGSSLDDLVFDGIFKPETDEHPLLKRLGADMRAARRNAACFLETGEKNCVDHHREYEKRKPHRPPREEIYKKAENLYGGGADWEKKVEPMLRLSKAARCFVIPLALIFMYDNWPNFLPRMTAPKNLFAAFTFLALPSAKWLSLAACLGLFLAYIYLRLAHMEALYRLVPDQAVLKRVQLQPQLELHGPEETVYDDACLFFVSSTELRQVLPSSSEDHRYVTVLLFCGAEAARVPAANS